MTVLQEGIAVLLVTFGIFLMVTGSVGIIRFPDFYSRTHATSKVDTLGIILLLGGLAVHYGFSPESGKLVMGIIFVILANPVASHALARAAYRVGVEPEIDKSVEIEAKEN